MSRRDQCGFESMVHAAHRILVLLHGLQCMRWRRPRSVASRDEEPTCSAAVVLVPRADRAEVLAGKATVSESLHAIFSQILCRQFAIGCEAQSPAECLQPHWQPKRFGSEGISQYRGVLQMCVWAVFGPAVGSSQVPVQVLDLWRRLGNGA